MSASGYIKFLRSGIYGDRVTALRNDGARWRWWLLVVGADRTTFPGLISDGGLRPHTDLDIINMNYRSNEHDALPDKIMAWESDKGAYLITGLLKSTRLFGCEYLWSVDWHTYQDKFTPKKKSCGERFLKTWMSMDEKDRLVFLCLIYRFRPAGIIETFEDSILEKKVEKLIVSMDSKIDLLKKEDSLKILQKGFEQITESVGDALSSPTKKAPNPDVKKIIDYFRESYAKKHDAEYLVSWEKDGAIIVRLLKAHKADDVYKLIDRFMTENDEWVNKAGRTIGILSTQVNRLISKKRGGEIDYDRY